MITRRPYIQQRLTCVLSTRRLSKTLKSETKMKNNQRVPLLKNFWYETDREKDPVLYQDQLGWQEIHQMESGGYTEQEDIWQHLIGFSGKKVVGWDLGFFYVPTRTFYYLDQMAKVIYTLPLSQDESEPLFARVDICPQIVP